MQYSPRYNCTGHIHFQNCSGKDSTTKINSVLQGVKENLANSLKLDHYTIHTFINCYQIHQDNGCELLTSMPQRGIKHIELGKMSPTRKIYFFVITHGRYFIPISGIVTSGLSSPVTYVQFLPWSQSMSIHIFLFPPYLLCGPSSLLES